MSPILFITLFSSCVSALVLQPLITPAPQIAVRDGAQSICGFYSLYGQIGTISCDFGTPCLIATNLSPAVGYCSGDAAGPITSVYAWGNWPSNQGCDYGSACCPVTSPSAGKWLLNAGSTVVLGCDSIPFTYTAFLSTAMPMAVSVAKPTSTTPRTSTATNPNFAQNTSPVLDSTATPTTPQPSQTASSTGLSDTTKITVIVVCAVVALISGLVFLWFLYLAWRLHLKAKSPPQPYTHLPYQYSNPSLNSMPPVKKSGLGKWAKIATILSPIFAIVGLVVAIYFGLKQK